MRSILRMDTQNHLRPSAEDRTRAAPSGSMATVLGLPEDFVQTDEA